MVDLEFSEQMDTLLPSGHVGNQVHHTVAVSILVVVPEIKRRRVVTQLVMKTCLSLLLHYCSLRICIVRGRIDKRLSSQPCNCNVMRLAWCNQKLNDHSHADPTYYSDIFFILSYATHIHWPGHELHEVVIESNASFSVKDARMSVTDEVWWHNLYKQQKTHFHAHVLLYTVSGLY